VLVDSSAVIALHDQADQNHELAVSAFASSDRHWIALDITSHECYTSVRYRSSYRAAVEHYSFLREQKIRRVALEDSDEAEALRILSKYQDHSISFHDALCAAAMLRLKIVTIFSFDSHFYSMGFVLLPGVAV